MSLLPPSTNADYRGALVAPAFLGLLGVLTLAPGAIHYLLPDGGAGVIAGLDLSANRATIVGIFAWMGATQIPYGLAQLAVAVRFRSLTPLFLALALLECALGATAAWITKAAPGGHHPPNHYGVVVLIPVIAVFLVLSRRRRKPA